MPEDHAFSVFLGKNLENGSFESNRQCVVNLLVGNDMLVAQISSSRMICLSLVTEFYAIGGDVKRLALMILPGIMYYSMWYHCDSEF